MKLFLRLLSGLALLLAFSAAQALDIQPYSAEALQAAQQAGKPVALHFRADWCPTCRAQDKVFQSLKSDATLPLTLLLADYDQESRLKKALGVRTQSTVIVYRGTKETGRLAGDTDAAKLRGVLQSAL